MNHLPRLLLLFLARSMTYYFITAAGFLWWIDLVSDLPWWKPCWNPFKRVEKICAYLQETSAADSIERLNMMAHRCLKFVHVSLSVVTWPCRAPWAVEMPQFCKCRSLESNFHTSSLCHDQHTLVASDVIMRLALQVFGQEPKSWHFKAANVNTLCWTKASVQSLLNVIYFVPIGKVVSMESRYFPESPKHGGRIFGSVDLHCFNFALLNSIKYFNKISSDY